MATNSANLAASAPAAERAAFALPSWTAVDTGTNAALAATVAALAGKQHYLTHFTVSFSAALAAAATVTVKDGSTTIWQVEIGTGIAIFTENFETRSLHSSTNAALTVNVGAAGSGVVQTISAAGFSIAAP